MGLAPVGHVVELDVVALRAADHGLLLRGAERVPGAEVVQVLLHDDVAAAGVHGILVADDGRGVHLGTGGIRGAVHEAQQVARVEVAEAGHLVHHGYGVAERRQQQPLELEREVAALGPDVEEEVARRRHRGVHPAELPERVQLARRRDVGEPRPDVRADRDVARQVRVQVAEPDRLHQPREVAQHVLHRGDGLGRIAHRHDEEDRRPRERGVHALGLDRDALPAVLSGGVGHGTHSAVFGPYHASAEEAIWHPTRDR